MNLIKKTDVTTLLGIMSLSLLAWVMQSTLYLNWDVSWYVLVSKRLLEGGTYTQNFFDVNPPLIFFVYAPVVFIMQYSSLSEVVALKVYVFVLIWLSIWVCTYFLRRIFKTEPSIFVHSLILSLLIVFLFLPIKDFGQREHITVIFTFPYFLLLIDRLQNNKPRNTVAILVGALAFIGFAIKPYFLAACLLVECSMFLAARSMWFWVRAEVLTILTLLLAYAGVIFIYFPDYVSAVVALSQPFYYAGLGASLHDVLLNLLSFFCCIAVFFHGILYKNNPYKQACTLLVWALIGFFIAYVMQQTNWSYHLLPAVSIAFFLLTLLWCLVVKNNLQKVPVVMATTGFFFFIPLMFVHEKFLEAREYKVSRATIISFLNTYAQNQPVYFITADAKEVFPTVHESNALYASRFLHLFWVPAVARNTVTGLSPLSKYAQKEEEILVNMVANDIENHQVKYIFIDIKDHKTFFPTHSFEYLPYLLKNQYFKKVFGEYQFVTTIESQRASLTSPWALYWVKNINSINPRSFAEDTVILTGEKSHQEAYYVQDGEFIGLDNLLLKTPVELSHQERSLLAKEGKVVITKENAHILHPLLNRITLFPIYKFAVYVRKNTRGIMGPAVEAAGIR